MKQLRTKDQISEYLKLHTKTFDPENLTPFTTAVISRHFNLSRSVTSQYLNELRKEENLVKINTRPVYFFHRNLLEQKYQVQLTEEEFLNVESFLTQLLRNKTRQKDFADVIGYESSLYDCISQVKSALIYPKGLPVILYGENGCGKKYLVNKIYEHCKSVGLISKSAKLITFAVTKNHPSSVIDGLFGTGETQGLIKQASGGILHIQNASNLNPACQEKIAQYLAASRISSVKKTARIIFTTCENPTDSMAVNLILNVPVICRIPSLEERTREERIDFIVRFFRTEEAKIGKNIMVSKHLFEELVQMRFDNNLNELQKCITGLCAKAYMHAKITNSVRINATLHDLNSEHLSVIQLYHSGDGGEIMLDVEQYRKNTANTRILSLFNSILDAHRDYLLNRIPLGTFCIEGYKYMRQYYDFVVFEEECTDLKIKVIEKLINELLESAKNQYSFTLPLNCSFILARILYSSQKINSSLNLWEQERRRDIQACLAMLKKEMPDEITLSENIARKIYTNLDLRLMDIHTVFLTLNINFYNKDLKTQDIAGIVLSHGYSTSSSIADAVNQLLGVQVFLGIDMPLDTAVEDISAKINRFVSMNPSYKNILLMVDMGSLEEIGNQIQSNVNIGVINNISTATALNIGSKILNKMDLETILHTVCEESKCRCRILTKSPKEKAIVFTNDAGLKISERLAMLFKNSLPKSIDLNFLAYDFRSLHHHALDDILFKKYDVILMVKPSTLSLPRINSVSLEDIVSFKDIDKANNALSDYLNPQEIELFNQQLLKNFSMQSVMENLTILNASKLLDYVSQSINDLQMLIRARFQSKTIIGIYIHICFLIERLVTQNAIGFYEGLEDFEKHSPQFIDYVNKSFEPMLKHYNVKMPMSEIAYLHDYILNDIPLGVLENEEL